MSYRKHLMTRDEPPSELYKATEVGTNLAEVGTDAITKQQAIDALRKLREEDIEDYGCEIPEGFNQDHLDRATFAIKQLPPIQPKKGKWIKTARWGRVYYCNQCRNYLDFDGVNAGRGSTNFCPNCGAKMEVTT